MTQPIGINIDRPVANNVDRPFLNIFKDAVFWSPTGAKSSTVTITSNSPSAATVNWTSHGLSAGACFTLSVSGGTLATESTTSVALQSGGSFPYYVLASGLAANSLQFSPLPGGTAIVTSGSSTGTITADCNNCDNISLDANGYPTSLTLTNGSGTATSFGSACLRPYQLGVNQPASYYYEDQAGTGNGTYVLLYTGSAGVVTLSGDFAFVGRSATGRDIYNVATASQGGCTITVTGAVSNMALIYSPGSTTGGAIGANEAAYNNGTVFYQPFINKVKIFKALRFMQARETIHTNESNWADRTPTTYFTYASTGATKFQCQQTFNGWPFEHIITLCNQLNIDCWVCIPWRATDNYITSLATLLKGSLNTNLKAYVEYGNEYWNFGSILGSQLLPGNVQMAGTAYAIDPFKSLYTNGFANFSGIAGGDWFDAQFRWCRYMMIHTADLCAAVFTGGDASRLVRIAGGQAGDPAGKNTVTLGYTVANSGATGVTWTGTLASHMDAMCIDHYFAYAPPSAWTADSDGGLTKLFNDMSTGVIPSVTTGAIAATGGPTAYAITTGHGWTNGSPPPNGTFFTVQLTTACNDSPTLAIDSMSALQLTNTGGTNLGANAFGGGGTNYVVFCYTSQTSAGAVSPAQLRASGINANLNGVWGGWVGGQMQLAVYLTTQNYTLAHGTYGLRLIGYEGGQNFSDGGDVDTLEMNAQWDNRMTAAYQQLYTQLLAQNGNDLLVSYTLGFTFSTAVYWGVFVNILEPTTPKYLGLIDALGSAGQGSPSWLGRL